MVFRQNIEAAPKVMRVVTYSRVSTSHHDQKPEVQKETLQQYCTSRGWSITEEIVDHGYSGATDQRPGLKRLLALARSRKIDVIAVTKLDRLFRSLKHLVAVLDEFESLGVKFVSLHDQLDLTTASGKLMLHIVAAFSEFERALIRERTLAGLEHARQKGVRLGRPKIRDDKTIRRLRMAGGSMRDIAHTLGLSLGSVQRGLSISLGQSDNSTRSKT